MQNPNTEKKSDKKNEKGQDVEDVCMNEVEEPQKRNGRRLDEYQSFIWGSNGVKNSCFVDSFLEVLFQVWMRQDTHLQPKALEESLNLCKNKNFHESKMKLWTYLKDHAINRYDTFDYGDMAAITAVIDVLYTNTPEQEKSNYYLLNETRTKCLTNDQHN